MPYLLCKTMPGRKRITWMLAHMERVKMSYQKTTGRIAGKFRLWLGTDDFGALAVDTYNKEPKILPGSSCPSFDVS